MEGGVEAFVGAEFGDIRPEVDFDIGGREDAPAFYPVNPAVIGAIAFAIEPALVAAHDLACERGGIDTVDGLTGVGSERGGEDFLASLGGRCGERRRRGQRERKDGCSEGGKESESPGMVYHGVDGRDKARRARLLPNPRGQPRMFTVVSTTAVTCERSGRGLWDGRRGHGAFCVATSLDPFGDPADPRGMHLQEA